jgi:hypothetical protein
MDNSPVRVIKEKNKRGAKWQYYEWNSDIISNSTENDVYMMKNSIPLNLTTDMKGINSLKDTF